MMIHNLKLLEQFADAVANGEKNFEIRINDRGFQKGDLVQFRTISTDSPYIAKEHPVNDMYFEITYVLTGFEIDKDYCVFGIRRDRSGDTPKKTHAGWIPVSERLPETSDCVLCCAETQVMHWKHVTIGIYFSSADSWELIEDSRLRYNIVAWMPLPDPYKGGMQDDRE